MHGVVDVDGETPRRGRAQEGEEVVVVRTLIVKYDSTRVEMGWNAIQNNETCLRQTRGTLVGLRRMPALLPSPLSNPLSILGAGYAKHTAFLHCR